MTTNDDELHRILCTNGERARAEALKDLAADGVANPTNAQMAIPFAMNFTSLCFASAYNRIAALEKRLAETETKAMRFRGVHQPAEDYQRGDLVTHQGALWHCNRPTTDRPGSGGTDWQLAVKSGAAA